MKRKIKVLVITILVFLSCSKESEVAPDNIGVLSGCYVGDAPMTSFIFDGHTMIRSGAVGNGVISYYYRNGKITTVSGGFIEQVYQLEDITDSGFRIGNIRFEKQECNYGKRN